MMKKFSLLFVTMIFTILISACAAAPASGDEQNGAANAVQDYLEAIINQDADALARMTCPEWEETALLEMDSFIGVEATLDNAACSQTGTDGDSSLVECSGKILATYNNEQQEFDLAGRIYEVQNEGGEWLVCGAR